MPERSSTPRRVAVIGGGISGLAAAHRLIELDPSCQLTLYEAASIAEPRGVLIGLECHAQYSKTPDGLDRIYNLVDSPAIGINFDTGNAYLAGQDPYTWLERVADRLVHLHAKDISDEHSEAERGKVTGTPVGCACGDGVIDWARVVGIVSDNCPRDIVFSVECGTPEQAARSLEHLKDLTDAVLTVQRV